MVWGFKEVFEVDVSMDNNRNSHISLNKGKDKCFHFFFLKLQKEGLRDSRIYKGIKLTRFQIFVVFSIHEDSFF
jgi:hypothetical protein